MLDHRRQGNIWVAQLQGCENREQAEQLTHAKIVVPREDLPPLPAGEYYWCDLLGLRVINLQGIEFGQIDQIFPTGANDVIVVKNEKTRAIPYLKDKVVIEVDLQQGFMRVDWDADF